MRLMRLFPVLLLVFSGLEATAQEKAPASAAATPAPAKLDDPTRQLLDKVKASLQSAQSYEYTAQTSAKLEAQGMNQETSTQYQVAVKRPNKLLIQCKGGRLDGITMLSDGKFFYTYSATEKAYRKEEAPESLAGLTEEGYLPQDPLLGFVATFVEQDPLAPILEGVTSGTYAGKETSDGADVERLHFTLPDMEWDLWVGTGDKPLPSRLRPDVSKSLVQQAPQMAAVKVEMNVTYSNWSIGKDVPDDRFAFHPEEGSKELSEPKSPLEGKPAPSFSIGLLDGTKIDLAQHKGKDVVILDFWATSCKPCHMLMPVLEQVVEEFKGQNVVLYAVNQGEEPDLIRQFLETLGLNVTVALDADLSVSQQYGADSIPLVVIIGKDGVIRNVQLGVRPGLERRLRAMIKAAAAADPKA